MAIQLNESEKTALLEAIDKAKASSQRAINTIKNPMIVECHKKQLGDYILLERKITDAK